MTITAERLEEWKVLAEKATEGPWVWDDDENMYGEGGQRSADNFWPEAIIQTDSGYYGPNADDRAFIAAAPTAVPALIAEVERLREALTPSGHTKAAYIGDFKFVFELEWEGEEISQPVTVPWTTIKEIMAAILARSALQETPYIKE